LTIENGQLTIILQKQPYRVIARPFRKLVVALRPQARPASNRLKGGS